MRFNAGEEDVVVQTLALAAGAIGIEEFADMLCSVSTEVH
jgi:hypothetical protein